MKGEKSPLIVQGTSEKVSFTQSPSLWAKQKVGELREQIKGRNAVLLMYLALVVVAGTTNRVTFKIMQYSTINYSYFDSQITTFFYVPINFAVIFFKIYFTKSITPKMRSFPVYKFAVMGFLDSLQGLLIVVGGVYVPGIMQSLLMQGAVPVTMIFSVFMLRPRGCANCRRAKDLLHKAGITYSEQTTLPKNCDGECVCRLTVNGMEVEIDKVQAEQVRSRTVILETSSRGWKDHIKHFYLPTQYLGAAIIMSGLVVSMWESLVKSNAANGAGPIQWDLMFFSATIPTAISGVYKEIAFRDQDDMDVWYLNGWVALFQFLFGLTYAPLAAVLNDLPIKDIPNNLQDGFLCWLLGRNFIVPPHCSIDCGPTAVLPCCDSCDGRFPGVSSVSAFWGLGMYMVANIAYNVFLVLVIKYGSAALMYIASTIVLPLGSIMFTVHAIMGENAQQFTPYNGAGLIIVLLGLVIYRFLGKRAAPTGQTIVVGVHEPMVVERAADNPAHKPRTQAQIRSNYYTRLGLVSPDNSPHRQHGEGLINV